MSETANTPDLPTAAAANFAVHAGWAPRQVPGMRVWAFKEIFIADSGLDCDTFNVIAGAHFETATAAAQVEAALAIFRETGRPFSWWLSPGDQPDNLGDLLAGAGLAAAESELAMAVDFAQLAPAPPPAGLAIRRVRNTAQLADFATIMAANWTPPDPMVNSFFEQASEIFLDDDCPQWLYVGYLDDRPVATAEGTVGGGVMGIYNIGTLEAYRRRGIGAAMTAQPLLDARAAGLTTAVLQATADGAGIYQRLGFKTFGHIVEYKPPP